MAIFITTSTRCPWEMFNQLLCENYSITCFHHCLKQLLIYRVAWIVELWHSTEDLPRALVRSLITITSLHFVSKSASCLCRLRQLNKFAGSSSSQCSYQGNDILLPITAYYRKHAMSPINTKLSWSPMGNLKAHIHKINTM